jgi:hypothetical protein
MLAGKRCRAIVAISHYAKRQFLGQHDGQPWHDALAAKLTELALTWPRYKVYGEAARARIVKRFSEKEYGEKLCEILQKSIWSEVAWPSAHDFDVTDRRLAIGLSDGTARLFDVPNAPASSGVGAHDESVNGAAFDPNGSVLGPACGSTGSIVYGIAFHPNGSMLATACGESGSRNRASSLGRLAAPRRHCSA